MEYQSQYCLNDRQKIRKTAPSNRFKDICFSMSSKFHFKGMSRRSSLLKSSTLKYNMHTT